MQWIKNNQELLKNAVLALLVIIIGIVLVVNYNKNKEVSEAGTAVSPMMSFNKGGFEYSFDSVKWIFDAQASGKTKVNFTFNNFSRRIDKTPATFAIPFFAKFVDTSCVEVSEIPTLLGTPFADDETCNTGPLVAAAQCGDVDPTWITIHQCGERLVVSEKNSQKWEKVRTLNITKIVE